MRFMEDFHRHGMARGENSSFTMLIPKKKNPVKLSDFRPISLIRCIYKAIAKVLANRIIKELGPVISDTHATFILGRQILDGILVENEIVDEVK